MANSNIVVAILLLFTSYLVAPSPAKTRSPSGGHSSSRHEMFERYVKIGNIGMDNEEAPVGARAGKCLSGYCPTKKTGANFVNDFYDENVDGRVEKAEADVRASVLEGGNGKTRKTKVFEADYVHLGVRDDPPQAPNSGNCPGCRILNVVISDVTAEKRKILSDIKLTL